MADEGVPGPAVRAAPHRLGGFPPLEVRINPATAQFTQGEECVVFGILYHQDSEGVRHRCSFLAHALSLASEVTVIRLRSNVKFAVLCSWGQVLLSSELI